jgi:hypothetical protein
MRNYCVLSAHIARVRNVAANLASSAAWAIRAVVTYRIDHAPTVLAGRRLASSVLDGRSRSCAARRVRDDPTQHGLRCFLMRAGFLLRFLLQA